MTDEQSNELDMLLILWSFYTNNQPAIDTVEVLSIEFPKIGLNISAINSNLAGQTANIKGVAQNKTNLRNTLNDFTLNILNVARAWAKSINDDELAEQFHVSESGLERIKDDTMGAYCTHRHGLVAANITPLAAFGITPALLDAWNDAINAYTGKVSSPRQAVNVRSTYTDNLKLLFDNSHKLLKETIDPVMLTFKISNPVLYAAYVKARIVIERRGPSNGSNTNTDKGKIYGTVANASTGVAMPDITVLLLPTTKSKVTDSEGKFSFTALAAGEYIARIDQGNNTAIEQVVILEQDAEVEIELLIEPPAPEE